MINKSPYNIDNSSQMLRRRFRGFKKLDFWITLSDIRINQINTINVIIIIIINLNIIIIIIINIINNIKNTNKNSSYINKKLRILNWIININL